MDAQSLAAPAPTVDRRFIWLMSFCDLLTLLIAFFVILFSMSEVKQERFDVMVEGAAARFGSSKKTKQKLVETISTAKITVRKGGDLDYLSALLVDKFKGDPVLRRAIIQRVDDRLVVSLPSDAMFRPGSAQLSPTAEKSADTLGDVLRFIGNRVDVNGHTDTSQVSSQAYPSNWELSLARATNLSIALQKAGLTQEIHAYGFADSRFYDLSLKLPEIRRLELSRRTDIVLRDTRGQKLSAGGG